MIRQVSAARRGWFRIVPCLLVGALTGCEPARNGEPFARTSNALAFETPTQTPAANNALGAVGAADLDNNASVDIVAAGWNSGTASITIESFLVDGVVTQSISSPLGTGGEIEDLALGEINGDGTMDVLAINRVQEIVSGFTMTTAHLWLAFGDGSGSFGPSTPIKLDDLSLCFTTQVAMGDVDSDGDTDLIGGSCGELAVVRNLGGGVFTPPTYVGTNASGSIVALTAGDWNADGRADVAVVQTEPAPSAPTLASQHFITLLMGQADGGLVAAAPLGPFGGPPIALFGRDVDGDARLDLISVHSNFPSGGGSVRFLPGDGDGTLDDSISPVPTLAGENPSVAELADVTGDGHADVIAVGGTLVHVLAGDGTGTFANSGTYDLGLVSPARLRGLAGADVVGSGTSDVLMTINNSRAVTVVESKEGRLMLPRSGNAVLAAGSILMSHFDADGIVDLLINDTVGIFTLPEEPPPIPAAQLRVFPGTGAGTFGSPIVSGGPSNNLSLSALGDFDADGKVDVVATMTPKVELWLGSGLRTFSLSAEATMDVVPGTVAMPIAVGDFNRDSRLDAVAAFQRQADARPIAGVFAGDGAGGFAPPALLPLGSDSGMVPMDLLVSDLTRDGSLDLIASITDGFSRGAVVVLAGDGAGGFGAPTVLDAGTEARGLAFADVNLDTHQDVIAGTASGSNGGLRIWFGDASGGLSAPTVMPIDPPIQSGTPLPPPGSAAPAVVLPGDFDSNGTVDLALAQAQTTLPAQLLSGVGDGTFNSPLTLPIAAGALGIGDLDADGRLDIVGTSTLQLWGSLTFVVNADLNQNTACLVSPCSSVGVSPVDLTRGTTPVAITFSTLIDGGLTRVESNTYGPLPPFGFQLGTPAEYFHIFSTALFSGVIEICIDYNPLSYLNPAEVRLFHYDNGAWEELPSTNDSANGRICGETLSLSPFALVEPIRDGEPEEVVLPAMKDAVLHRNEPNLNGGANTQLTVSDDSRVLVGFDLSGVDLSRVESARLIMTVDDVDGAGRGVVVDAHRVTEVWAEGNGRNGRRNDLGSGEGVTWSCATDRNIANRAPNCARRWSGGSFASHTRDGVVHSRRIHRDVSWDVTDDVLADGGNSWILKLRLDRGNQSIRYSSRDASGPSEQSSAPRLVLSRRR